MKKLFGWIFATLGIISTLLSIADAFPQYQSIFISLIFVSVGYALGSFASRGSKDEQSNPKGIGMIIAIALLCTPVALLLIIIVTLKLIDFLTEPLLKAILGWGALFLLITYIFGGAIVYDWATLPAQNKNQSED